LAPGPGFWKNWKVPPLMPVGFTQPVIVCVLDEALKLMGMWSSPDTPGASPIPRLSSLRLRRFMR
jgi:hypothetical protein